MSDFKVEVVPVTLQDHPNADNLSIVEVFGYRVVVRTDEWRNRTSGTYIPPDSVVPATQEFAFLGDREKDRRVTVRRFRGVLSEGLLMPAPANARIGDDVSAVLGITHYEPPLTSSGTYGAAESPPLGVHPVYDLEHHKRYGNLLRAGEPVVISEKVHGTNAKYTFQNGRMYAGSRREWKRPNTATLWWDVLRMYPQIEELCRANPDITLYGEIYGDVQDLKYGCKKGETRFAAFDLYRGPASGGRVRRFLDRIASRLGYQPMPRGSGFLPFYEALDLCMEAEVPWVPLIEVDDYDLEHTLSLVDGPTLVPNAFNLREGIVVRPITERTDPTIGRIHLKLISSAYLERSPYVPEAA